jgi:hypothetical protein
MTPTQLQAIIDAVFLNVACADIFAALTRCGIGYVGDTVGVGGSIGA